VASQCDIFSSFELKHDFESFQCFANLRLTFNTTLQPARRWFAPLPEASRGTVPGRAPHPERRPRVVPRAFPTAARESPSFSFTSEEEEEH